MSWPDVGFAVEVGSSEVGGVGSGCVVVRSEVEVAGVVAPVVGSAVAVGSAVVVAGVADPSDSCLLYTSDAADE